MPRYARFTTLFVAAALAAFAAGCAKKVTVDAALRAPEGVTSSKLELLTYYDQPNAIVVCKDRGRVGLPDLAPDPASVDSILLDPNTLAPSITPVRDYTPGTVRGLVMDRTPASELELFRAEANGGIRRVFDHTLQPVRRFLDQQVEVFTFADDDPRRAAGGDYFVRGVIEGAVGGNSPISNPSHPTTNTITQITYLATRQGQLPPISGPPAPAESTFWMKWTPVTGASRYWVHVFQYLPSMNSVAKRVRSGAASPMVGGDVRDLLVASVPATLTEYKYGDPVGTTYTYRTPRMRQEYFVRISAVDAGGQLIGMTTGPSIASTRDLGRIADARDYFTVFGTDGTYQLISRGAVRVSPGEVLTQTAPATALGLDE